MSKSITVTDVFLCILALLLAVCSLKLLVFDLPSHLQNKTGLLNVVVVENEKREPVKIYKTNNYVFETDGYVKLSGKDRLRVYISGNWTSYNDITQEYYDKHISVLDVDVVDLTKK